MDAKAFHHRKAARDATVAHHPHERMAAFGRQRSKIPKRVMRRLGLGDCIVWLGLHRMDEIRELDCVLNEKYRYVVSNQIPNAFPGISPYPSDAP